MSYHYIVLEIDEAAAEISRDVLQKVLWAENILARRYFFPGVHRMEPYRSFFPHAGMLLPETERLVTRTLCLPSGTAVGPDEIERICQVIRFALAHGQLISQREQGSTCE